MWIHDSTQELGKLFEDSVLGSEKVKRVENIKYLASMLKENGSNNIGINERGRQAVVVF